MNINDLKNYFFKVDSSGNGRLEQEEVNIAMQEGSIFSSVLEVDMNYETYIQSFVSKHRKLIDIKDLNANADLPYHKEESPQVQPQIWEPIGEIYSKEYINEGSNSFRIKTSEATPVSSDLNFSTDEGEYMLKYMSFDSETFKNTPSEYLPEGFEPDDVILKGKDPGINIKTMHSMGYTGKNITVACIDTPILTTHSSIKSNLVGYEVMNNTLLQEEAYFHGQAVADILSGNECGAAPDSKLVYFAGVDDNNDRLQALQRILEVNRNSDPKDKIRVLSISWDIDSDEDIYTEYQQLLQELKDDGVCVFAAGFSMVDGTLGSCFEIGFLEKKDQMGNPDDFSNYTGHSGYNINPEKTLLVPSGDRTVASAMGEEKYRHDSNGSTSWSIPALAGIYASALQCADENGVELTPEKFQEWALETCVAVNNKNGELGGYAIDAEALCKKIIEIGNKEHRFGL